MDADAVRHLAQIAREAVANAIQHSGASLITVELRQDDAELRLTVTDDGRGFEPRSIETPSGRGHGIPNLRERGRQVGGRLEIDSRAGQGTRVSLSLSHPEQDRASTAGA
jgi:signal transduction histidine kinase